jgi:hypothetical protein
MSWDHILRPFLPSVYIDGNGDGDGNGNGGSFSVALFLHLYHPIQFVSRYFYHFITMILIENPFFLHISSHILSVAGNRSHNHF